MGPAMLIASGGGADEFHERLFAELPRAPSVAWIGAASGDDARWFDRGAEHLRKRFGARVTLARTVVERDRASILVETRAIIADAQLIYIGGGDVSQLADYVCTDGLDALIRTRRQEGAAVLGVSAGAIGLSPSWIAFPDDESQAPSLFACIGAVPISFDVHDEAGGWEELRALLDAMAKRDPDAVVDAWGIPHGGALFLDGNDVITPLGAAPARLRLDHGRVVA